MIFTQALCLQAFVQLYVSNVISQTEAAAKIQRRVKEKEHLASMFGQHALLNYL